MRKFYFSVCAFVLTAFPPCVSAQTVPTGFNISDIGSAWNQAVGAAYTKDGKKIFVWEKAGNVFVCNWDAGTQKYVKQTTPVLDISPEVGDWRDFGLIGFALDPDFDNNGLIYLLYVVDRHYLMNFGTASYSDTANEYFNATIGRVTRYKTITNASNQVSTNLNTRKILLGESKTTGIPILFESHGVGSLVFASDGTLLVSTGETASYNGDDHGSYPETYYLQGIADGIIRPEENVGSFRSQMINSFSGKILRIDPNTGDGLSNNPFYQAANPRAPRSRVWALGLRNPYRMTIKPNSGSTDPATGDIGEIYVGDVGGALFEELNIINQPGQNCGWPIYEGEALSRNTYANYVVEAALIENKDEPNPLYGIGGCTKQYFTFADLLKEVTADGNTILYNPCNSSQTITSSNNSRFVHHRPVIDWVHANRGPDSARIGIFNGNNAAVAQLGSTESGVQGTPFFGNCTNGGIWYTGTAFPTQYQNTFFFSDFVSSWIKMITMKNATDAQKVDTFATGFNAPVFLTQNPMDGSLLLIDYWSSLGGRLYAIKYGGNQAPVVKIASDKIFGPSILSVKFTGSTSFDPEGSALTYLWDFGDATSSTIADPPTHDFTSAPNTPKKFVVKLTVTDNLNNSSIDSIVISVNNTPPVVNITSPIKNSMYNAGGGDTIYALKAIVIDAEQVDGQLKYEWQTILRHNTHQHLEQIDTNRITSTVISRVGCNGDIYYFLVTLKVTDAAGLSSTDSSRIFPLCPGDIILPVTLSSFSVNTQENVNVVKWTTDSEVGSKEFILERSVNGQNFQTINQQSSTNLPGTHAYSFNDDKFSAGLNYYRLKMVDINGDFTYSKTVKVFNGSEKDFNLRITPNPVFKEFTLSTAFPETGPVTIRISDVNGRVVKQISDNVSRGYITMQVYQLEKLRAGTYFVEVIQKDYKRTTKFVKID